MEIRAFIAAYRAAWDGVLGGAPLSDLDGFFHRPCLVIAGDGGLTTLRTVEEIEAFNADRLEAFLKGGVVAARLRGVDVTSQGAHLALAVVNWELHRGDGSSERAWRHHYTIRATEAGPRILVSGFDPGA